MTKKREVSTIDRYNFCWKCHNGEYIFEDNCVKEMFLESLNKALGKYIGVKVSAYTIMSNHVHLVIGGKLSQIESVTKSVGSRFAKAYHRYSGTTGEIFERRYFSKPINDINYYLCAMAYVFNNPVKANMVDKPQQYQYSNFKNIYEHSYKSQLKHLIDEQVANSVVSEEELVKFTLDNSHDLPDEELELYPKDIIYDFQVRDKLRELVGERISDLKKQSSGYLSILVWELLNFGSCIFQIARVTGLGDHKVRTLARRLE